MRMIITDLPTLLKEIVASIASKELDVELLDVSHSRDLAKAVRDTVADVVVTAASHDPRRIVVMLDENPRLRVITVGERGRIGWLWELRPHRQLLGELTVPGLMHALRRPKPHNVIELSGQQ